jgi:hypothetical protein
MAVIISNSTRKAVAFLLKLVLERPKTVPITCFQASEESLFTHFQREIESGKWEAAIGYFLILANLPSRGLPWSQKIADALVRSEFFSLLPDAFT